MVKRMRSFFAVVMLVIAATVNAQVTTSSMSGKVVDQSNEAIIGATIQAIHEPSGTHYGAITNVDGRYSIELAGRRFAYLSGCIGTDFRFHHSL